MSGSTAIRCCARRLLLADPDLLDQVFELGGASDGVNVALVSGQ